MIPGINEGNDQAFGFLLGVVCTFAFSTVVALAFMAERKKPEPVRPRMIPRDDQVTEWDRIEAALRGEPNRW